MATLGRVVPFCRYATFSPFHRGHLPRNRGRSGLYRHSYSNLRDCFVYYYSAINANAFETVVLAIVAQLQSPYEYLR